MKHKMISLFRRQFVIILICYLLKVFDLCTDENIGFFGCNAIILNNSTSIARNKETARGSLEKEDLTRVIGFNHGPTHDHAVRISLISDYKTAICAGAVQNARYIITAAHCVSSVDPSQLIVTAGTGPIFPEFPEQNRSVVSLAIHPDWDPDTLMNDIALLELNHSLFLAGGQVRPSPLGPPIPAGGNVTDVWVTGWGLFELDKIVNGIRYHNRTYPTFRQSALVALVDLNVCKDAYQKQGRELYKTQICAQAKVGTGPCTGEDGGPLSIGVLYSNLVWRVFVIGILSSYQDCATGAIDIYTELGSYKNWIESIAGRQCEFNIYAYSNEKSIKKPYKRQSSKPKGQIDIVLAYAICASYYTFTYTSKIQGLLTRTTTLANYSSSKNSASSAFACTILQWNTCRKCPRFERVLCKDEVNAKSVFKIASRIIGGHDAAPNQNPHQVRIDRVIDDLVTSPPACGGIIYNSMYVITVAECVNKNEPCWLVVTAGDHSLTNTEETEQVRRVVSIIVHEHYDREDAYKNNIALLRLNRPFNVTKYVHSLLLGTKQYPTINVTSVELSGWGFLNTNRDKPDILQAVEVLFVDDCDCRLAYASSCGSPINLDKICAGSRGHGICLSDNGSPWTVKDGKTRYVVGLTSFTGSCTVGPGVATKLLSYSEWINMRAGIQDIVNTEIN